ncbi:extracellular solute-binding protein [Chloroflexia bacterium SDU3-3]|nr:extracellular solute-binding protein [Chloroflexia bacterium SDU3-3]
MVYLRRAPMKINRPWIASAASLLCMLLASCTMAPAAATPQPTQAATPPPASTSAPTPTAGTSAPVTLRVAWWGSKNRHDRTLQVIDLFEKAHPNVTVVPVYVDFKDYWDLLGKQEAEGTTIDVIQQDYSRIGEWVSKGKLLSLNRYVSEKDIHLDGVADEQLAGGRIGDQMYGISLGTNAITLLYDPAQFKAAGVAEPTADWTWDDFKQAATTLHDKLGIYGVEQISNLDVLKIYLKEHGKWPYNDQRTGLGYTDDRLASSFFQLLVDLDASGAMAPLETDSSRGGLALEESLIVNNKAAMKMLWSNQAVALSAANPEHQLALVQTPRVAEGSEGLFLKPSMFFSISSKTQHPDAAALFIDFFINSPEANTILAAERGVPIIPAVRKAIKPNLLPMQQEVFRYIGEVETVASPLNPPDPTSFAKISAEIYDPLINQLLSGQITADEAAAQLRAQLTAILQEK